MPKLYSIVRLIVIGHPLLSVYHGSTFSAGPDPHSRTPL